MWIVVQLSIFLFFILTAVFLPKKVYQGMMIIGILFSILVVFANWLLTIQVVNIILSGVIGLTIIEKRNQLVTKIGDFLLNGSSNSSKLREDYKSKMKLATLLAAIVVLMDIEVCMSAGLFNPITWKIDLMTDQICNFLWLLAAGLLLTYTITYKRRNAREFLIPVLLKTGIYVFKIIHFRFSIMSMYMTTEVWYILLCYMIPGLMLALTISIKMQKKKLVAMGAIIPALMFLVNSIISMGGIVNDYKWKQLIYLLAFGGVYTILILMVEYE